MSSNENEIPVSDATSRSDWFRQTVLFWSSKNASFDGSDVAYGEHAHRSMISQRSSVVSDSSDSRKADEGDCTIDIHTSELLMQVQEFEHCFSELTKLDDLIKKQSSLVNLTVEEDESTTTETQSPHLTLEFPTGSAIRDSPLYVIPDAPDAFAAHSEFMSSADLLLDEEERKVMDVQNDILTLDGRCERKDVRSHDSPENLTQNKQRGLISEIPERQDGGVGLEMNCDDRGDPNDVLRNMLSCIKPPDRRSMTRTPSPALPVDYIPFKGYPEILSDTRMNGNSIDNSLQTHNEILLNASSFKSSNDNTGALMKQIDTLMEMEKKGHREKQTMVKKNPRKDSKQNRLESGHHDVGAEATLPLLSPMVLRTSSENMQYKSPVYDSGYIEQLRHTTHTIYESPKEKKEWDLNDDSDLSSDWSPLSTIDSADFSATSIGKLSRSHSVPHSSNVMPPYHPNRRTSTGNLSSKKRVSSTSPYSTCDGSSVDLVYSESELSAIRKFLTLTRKYFDKGSESRSSSKTCLDELAMMPNVREVIDAQGKELKEQREMLEGFIRQLGELLVDIVNLKEEQNTVRSKQAKALTLLKKQLDNHKKHQSAAYSDLVEQIKFLKEKSSNSVSTEHLTLTPVHDSAKSSSLPSRSHSSSSNSVSPCRPIVTNKHGQLVWKISDVMRKISRIKSGVIDGTLVSSPFQTGEYEYNMNAWIYLNGRGKMVGKYISVYACVLVGEYDAILPWPVTPTYKFTLIDQRSDPNKRQDHMRSRRVLDIAGRGENIISQNGGIPRPTDGSKALIVGLDDFIAHEQLLQNRYLVDDVIFLKVEAEIN